ncbi:hypothetical protein SMD11_4605 [Streptomyces albireticuli]|uniref:Uncharacterized protein n=1 Tax=Streptomyces albireticuli TaxID=1940 RepID=A0A1Z2L7E4_9ACTN|nr:hypothetical protein SMD11_4605 [Streptomyces albireticuli]
MHAADVGERDVARLDLPEGGVVGGTGSVDGERGLGELRLLGRGVRGRLLDEAGRDDVRELVLGALPVVRVAGRGRGGRSGGRGGVGNGRRVESRGGARGGGATGGMGVAGATGATGATARAMSIWASVLPGSRWSAPAAWAMASWTCPASSRSWAR